MLRVATVATHPKYYFHYLEKTCARWNVKLEVLGMGEKWEGYVWKFKKILEFLRSVPADDIVCFVDGYDVVATRDLNELVPKFLEIKERENCDMIVAKDHTFLFPLNKIANVYFGTCNGIQINSGTYIGYSLDLLRILEDALKIFPDEKDDQKLLTNYCSIYSNKIYIDKQSDLFQASVVPMKEMKLNKKRPFFAHAAGCGYLTDILVDMGYSVDPNIKKELRTYLIKKASEHTLVFLKRYFLVILAVILAVILVIILILRLSKRR